ncbi:hypothetical protein [Streptomyces sp. NRRL B-2790]|uniref:hypothetical protein n=1 Tax=Streptomyces sp. NRRL B-2790 TaxID=1463835 RepID=UPI0035636189
MPLAKDVVRAGPVDQLHDDQRAPVDLGDVVHGDHAGVAHPGGGASLALHPQPQLGQLGPGGVRVGAQFLDGGLAAEDLVDRPPQTPMPPRPSRAATR